MHNYSLIDKISFFLVIVGAVNWGLLGLFNLNILKLLLESFPVLLRITYIIVGVSGLDLILVWLKNRKQTVEMQEK